MNLLLVYTGITSLLSVIVLVLDAVRTGGVSLVWLLLAVLLLGFATHAGSLKSRDSAPMGPLTRAVFCTPQQRELLRLLGMSESRRTSCNPSLEQVSKLQAGIATARYVKTEEGGIAVLVVEPISR